MTDTKISANAQAAAGASLILLSIAQVADEYDAAISTLVALRDTVEFANISDTELVSEVNELIAEGETIANELYDEFLELEQALIHVTGPLNLTATDRKYRHIYGA